MYLILKVVGGIYLLGSFIGLSVTVAMVAAAQQRAPAAAGLVAQLAIAVPVISFWTGGMVTGCVLYVGGHVLEYVQRRTAGMDAAAASAE